MIYDAQDLISSVDILEYISQYTDFEKRGEEYWALSPLKKENTPSFSVRKETNSFYDFSSGIGGNVITFIRYHDKVSYKDAVEILKKYLGDSGCAEGVRVCKRLSAAEVAKKYSAKTCTHNSQPSKPKVVLPDDYMQRYEKKSDKLDVWRKEGISDSSLERFQVYYDRYSNRLVYPIKNIEGKIVNIGGRTLDENYKEKKLRKYTYFMQWGELNVIYGLSDNMEYIKEKREIILFEGCKSVLIADTWGVRNTGAILTSHLNPNQLKLLISLGCRVVFALDKDVNIRKDYNISKLRQFATVEYIYDKNNLLKEKDSPVDEGFDTWQQLYNERRVWH